MALCGAACVILWQSLAVCGVLCQPVVVCGSYFLTVTSFALQVRRLTGPHYPCLSIQYFSILIFCLVRTVLWSGATSICDDIFRHAQLRGLRACFILCSEARVTVLNEANHPIYDDKSCNYDRIDHLGNELNNLKRKRSEQFDNLFCGCKYISQPRQGLPGVSSLQITQQFHRMSSKLHSD